MADEIKPSLTGPNGERLQRTPRHCQPKENDWYLIGELVCRALEDHTGDDPIRQILREIPEAVTTQFWNCPDCCKTWAEGEEACSCDAIAQRIILNGNPSELPHFKNTDEMWAHLATQSSALPYQSAVPVSGERPAPLEIDQDLMEISHRAVMQMVVEGATTPEALAVILGKQLSSAGLKFLPKFWKCLRCDTKNESSTCTECGAFPDGY